MNTQKTIKSLYCISFDGLEISGIVEESIKLAHIFHRHGYQIYLDLGYDIRPRSYFGKPYTETHLFPQWVHLTRLKNLLELEGYTQSFILELIDRLIKVPNDPSRAALLQQVEQLSQQIASHLVEAWHDHNVRYVVVEYATLPENIIYTLALRKAIEQYGQMKGLGRYVLWRDYDVVWLSVELNYSSPFYTTIPKLPNSPYILHVAVNEKASQKLSEWCQGVRVETLPLYHTFSQAKITHSNRNFRNDRGIPENSFLIARCSRIVPHKRIDRDIHLLSRLGVIMKSRGIPKDIYLFITGVVDENVAEYERLKQLASDLNVQDNVCFGNGLLSFEEVLHQESSGDIKNSYSVKDLLAHADLSSFLASYRFEGYGLPPGEAIASGVPYITTTYELYETIYGSKGFKTLELPISADRDDLATETYIQSVFDFLMLPAKRQEYAEFNYQRGKALLSMEQFEKRLATIFPGAFTSREAL